MVRILSLLALLAASNLSWAQAYDPKIAYTSLQGKADNLMVANANGGNAVAIYKTTSGRLGEVDMAPIDPSNPSSRRIAFTESGVLKVLAYEVLPSGVRAIGAPLVIDSTGAPAQGAKHLDFSPDGTRLIYSRNVYNAAVGPILPQEIRLAASSGTGSPVVLVYATHATRGYLGHPRWLTANEFAYLRGFLDEIHYSTDIQLSALIDGAVTGTPLTLATSADPAIADDGTRRGFEGFDVSGTRDALLLTVSGPSNLRSYVEYSLVDESLTTHFADYGWQGRFINGDAQIVYLHQPAGQTSSSDYVQRYDIATGAIVKLTSKKGAFGFLDTQR